MTVSADKNRIDYTGDGSSTIFAYDFKIFDENHLEVYLDGVKQTITTHYTVSGVGNQNGGNVTFGTAPANLVKVAIIRVVPLLQNIDYQTGSKFPAETHEKGLDLLTMVTQQIKETFGRAIKLSISSTQKDKDIDDLDALKHLRVSADASKIEMVDAPTGTVSFPLTVPQGGTGKDNTTPVEGDLLVADATFVFTRLAKAAQGAILRTGAATLNWLAKGNDGELLESGASDIAWISRAAMFFKTLTTKGDLLVGTGATAQRKAAGANRTILEADSVQADGLAWVSRSLGLKSVQVFTVSGTWNRPAGIRRVFVEVVGGGGAGGGAVATGAGQASAGNGGGGGGYASGLIDVSAIASSTITIGAGGVGSTGNGPSGGNSSWADGTNTITGNGGVGGIAGAATSTPALSPGTPPAGGSGTSAAGGTVRNGDYGGIGIMGNTNTHTLGGFGGGSKIGGQIGGAIDSAGVSAGNNSGSGGSGAARSASLAAANGGSGGSGIVIVYEYE